VLEGHHLKPDLEGSKSDREVETIKTWFQHFRDTSFDTSAFRFMILILFRPPLRMEANEEQKRGCTIRWRAFARALRTE
jgi:hypothetical protein